MEKVASGNAGVGQEEVKKRKEVFWAKEEGICVYIIVLSFCYQHTTLINLRSDFYSRSNGNVSTQTVLLKVSCRDHTRCGYTIS